MKEFINKGKILVIDDDAHNIEIIKSVLETDYVLQTAENGKLAIDKIQCFLPDMILLDWNMPVMNGLETLQHLKRNLKTREIPVVMMTGYMTEPENLLLAYEQGVIDFIRKPFDILELKARTNSIYQLACFYKKEIQKKENELISSSVRLAELNELINDILQKIDQDKTDDFKRNTVMLNEIKMSLSSKISDSIWQQFDNHFKNVLPGFSSEILKKHPGLSSSEIKLASLLRLNLNTKEISGILHQTYDSIRVARTRLRKKLNLETEDGLYAYLLNF